MRNYSEKTFGAKLRNAQDLHTYISTFVDYNPAAQDITVAAYGDLIDQVILANSTRASSYNNYRTVVSQRRNAFKQAPNSLKKILSPIRAAIESQYTKKSIEYTLINSLVKRMRAQKLKQPPADPTAARYAKQVSQSHQSYGSLTQDFRELIIALDGLDNYVPTKPEFSISSLQTFEGELSALNTEVPLKIKQLKKARVIRLNSYDVLRERGLRIKAYVRSKYGYGSPEHDLVKGLVL